MASNDIITIEYFCHKCKKIVDMLSANESCARCGTGFIEEVFGTPVAAKNSKPQKDIRPPESPDKCCICLMELSREMTVKLVCLHSFHNQCLKGWLKTADNCPLCRDKVDAQSVVTPIRVNRGRGRIARRAQRSDFGALNNWTPHRFEDISN